MKKNIRKQYENYAGYSFIEGIVATFIVTAGMLAVVQLMTASLTVLFNSRNQTMATFLAQEGVELVRNIRDNNWAAGRATFNSPNFPVNDSTDCRADLYSTSINNCGNGNNKILQKNAAGIYRYDINSPNSGFQRKISIIYDTGNQATADVVTITSAVTWNSNDLPSTPTAANCNLASHCVFVSVVLNKWGSTAN